MIGVAVTETDLTVVAEFFELFKTPWEPAVPGRKYRVLLVEGVSAADLDADLYLIYGSRAEAIDHDAGVSVTTKEGPSSVSWGALSFPLYRGTALFEVENTPGGGSVAGKPIEYRNRTDRGEIRRVGYDLFGEVRFLLTKGQPAAEALTPTLDLHIALLRQLLLESDVPVLEVPARPSGYEFICCLTHDVDFFGIRRHRLDRTLAGFGFRASLGSLMDVLRGRRSLVEAGRNWVALLSLPLVFLGVLPDPWQPFRDYGRADAGRPSTFFLIPFKNKAGVAPDGTLNPRRAVAYDVSDTGPELSRGAVAGSELAVHGIDAWRDRAAAQSESGRLASVSGQPATGIRMHWLYFDSESAGKLEAAGFGYDSTWGYNEAVGYKAGTSQCFRFPGTNDLLELPLTIMDTALFYSGRMGLDRDEAARRCRQIIANGRSHGGAVVVNWHDRSLAPERQWDRFYTTLLNDIDAAHPVWFATAAEAVEWFRFRRSIRFAAERDGVTLHVAKPLERMPAVVVRTSRKDSTRGVTVDDRSFDGRAAVTVPL